MAEPVKKSFFNSNVDLLNGSIFKALIVFMIPLFISNIFQQLYNTVDTMIVGNYLGDVSLAAIGSCTSIYDLLVGFGLGIGNGLAIVTARSFGSKDEKLLKKSVASSIVIGIVASLIITILGSLILRPLLELLNTPLEIINEAYSYISAITLFIIVMFAYNLCAGLLRAIGNSMVPLMFLILSSCLNVVLDILFITKFSMGVQGAAVATVISQGVSVVLCVFYILKKTQILIPEKEHFEYDNELYKEMVGQGLSMGFMSSIVSAGSVILQSGINGMGYLTIAGHTAARRIFMFFNMPFSSLGLAMSTFVSQNKGAGQYSRIRHAIKICYMYNVVMTTICCLILWLFSKELVAAVSGSSESVVLANGSLYLMVVAPFYGILGVLIQTRFSLQGLGKKMLPLVSSIIEFVGKIIFVAIFIPRFGYLAVIFCEPVIWCVMTIQLVYSFYNNSYIRNANNKEFI